VGRIPDVTQMASQEGWDVGVKGLDDAQATQCQGKADLGGHVTSEVEVRDVFDGVNEMCVEGGAKV